MPTRFLIMLSISKMHNINTIIWDWNGTLFDDVGICIESINLMLKDRGLEQLSKDRYLEVFDFPVREYYQKIGFNFEDEPFEIPANQFIENYFAKVDQANLHIGVHHVLQYFKNKGLTQIVLSAAEQTKLDELLKKHEIRHFFQKVRGLDHDYATSKIDLGRQMLHGMKINSYDVCLIGDTVHDFEVASALGCFCILFANGHHPVEKLRKTGAPIIHQLDELVEIFPFA